MTVRVNSPDSGCTRDSGFTLVEVLISMFIFSLISTGAYLALASTLDAREAATERIAQVERLAAARRLMADDIAATVIRTNRDGLGGIVDGSRAAVDPNRLELTRRARPNPGGTFARGDLLRVAWRVEDGQLIRAFLPHENPARVEPALDRVVLDGVERMEVRRVLSTDILTRVASDAAGLNASDFDLAGLIRQQGEASEIGVLDVNLFHDDGTQTRHVFEWAP